MIAPVIWSTVDTTSLWEETLVRRLRDLDQAAWATVFDDHHDRIWRYAYARSGDRALADDIASQVFVEALESIHRFQYRGKPVLAWLYTIAKNHMGKHFRAARRETAGPPLEPSANPIEAAVDGMVLHEALASLTRDQADAIVLRFYSGYSTREIAGAMGKSEAAVYSLQIRALAALRERLASPQ